MKRIKSVMKIGMIVTLITASIPTMAFAQDLESKHISYYELNKAVVDKNDAIETLKDTQKDIGEALEAYSSPYISFRASGLGIRSSESARDGIFYGYAKPVLINKLVLEGNLTEVNYNIVKAEATIDYQLQKSLIELDYYNNLAELYEKRSKTLEVKYNDTKLKYEKGTVSKLELAVAESTMRQQALGTDKLKWQVKIIKAKLAQSASLESKYEYTFEVPQSSGGQFTIAKIDAYWDAVQANSATLAIQKAKWDSILNEEKVFETYKGYILESDILDFQRRKMAQKTSLEVEESGLRISLGTMLNDLEYANQNLQALKENVTVKQMDLKAAEINVKNKSLKESDLISYQLDLYAAELEVAKSKASRDIINKRVDTFVNLGVYIE